MCKHNLYVGLGSYEVYRVHMHLCIVKNKKWTEKLRPALFVGSKEINI